MNISAVGLNSVSVISTRMKGDGVDRKLRWIVIAYGVCILLVNAVEEWYA